MTLHFGDQTPDDGQIRCTQCGHRIVLRHGDPVPRCYCGGHDFHAATDAVPRARAPERDARAERTDPRRRDAERA